MRCAMVPASSNPVGTVTSAGRRRESASSALRSSYPRTRRCVTRRALEEALRARPIAAGRAATGVPGAHVDSSRRMSESEEEDDEYYLEEDELEEQRQTKIDALMKEKPEDVFKRFDKDESGFIDYDEFVQMLPELNIKMTEAKALKYFRVCDSDGSARK